MRSTKRLAVLAGTTGVFGLLLMQSVVLLAQDSTPPPAQQQTIDAAVGALFTATAQVEQTQAASATAAARTAAAEATRAYQTAQPQTETAAFNQTVEAAFQGTVTAQAVLAQATQTSTAAFRQTVEAGLQQTLAATRDFPVTVEAAFQSAQTATATAAMTLTPHAENSNTGLYASITVSNIGQLAPLATLERSNETSARSIEVSLDGAWTLVTQDHGLAGVQLSLYEGPSTQPVWEEQYGTGVNEPPVTAFSADSQLIAVLYDGDLEVYSLGSPPVRLLREYWGEDPVGALTISGENGWVAVGNVTGRIDVHPVDENTLLDTTMDGPIFLSGMQVLSENRMLIWREGELTLSTAPELRSFNTVEGQGDPAVNADGTQLAYTRADVEDTISLYTIEDDRLTPQGEIRLPDLRVRPLTYSPDGRFLLIRSVIPLRTVLWDIEAERAVATFDSLSGGGVFSLDSRFYLHTETDRLLLWDIETQQLISLPNIGLENTQIVIYPNGILANIASAEGGRVVQQWALTGIDESPATPEPTPSSTLATSGGMRAQIRNAHTSLRDEARANGTEIATLERDTIVTVLDIDERTGYVHIVTPTGQMGWVAGNALSYALDGTPTPQR